MPKHTPSKLKLSIVSLLGALAFWVVSTYPANSAEVSLGSQKNGTETEFLQLRTGYPQVLVLETEVSHVIVGNPESLTVTLLDPLHVLLTPKSRGTGSLSLLNRSKNVIRFIDVEVDTSPHSEQSSHIVIFKGTDRTDINCDFTDCRAIEVEKTKLK